LPLETDETTKKKKTSVGKGGVPAEIKTGHLPNTNYNNYCFSQLAWFQTRDYGIISKVWNPHNYATAEAQMNMVLDTGVEVV
jgi:hypothetical protein